MDERGGFIGRSAELEKLRFALGARTPGWVLLTASRRAGKTSLAHALLDTSEQLFPGGMHYLDFWQQQKWSQIASAFKLGIARKRRSLVVLDEFPENDDQLSDAVLRMISRYAEASVLIITEGHEPRGLPAGTVRLELGGLARDDWSRELARLVVEDRLLDQTFDFFGGHPAGLNYLRDSFRCGETDFEGLLKPLTPFEEFGIVDARGRPVRTENSNELPQNVVEVCSHVEARLLEAIQENPDLMYRISPREFELLVAELLYREGYEVEVTPATKDGGVDIFAVRSDSLGRVLFLVECKRYARKNPVQVDVVRSLYGNVVAKRASAGVLVTSSTFTRGAKSFQESVPHQMSLREYADIRAWLQRTKP